MRKAFTFLELMIVLAIIVILLSLVAYPLIGLLGGAFPNYSIGERAGTIYKLSYKGYLWKSYEGEMNLGGAAADANGSMVSNVFKFSVRDKAIVEKINEAAASGKRVTLHYRQYGIKSAWLDTAYVVDRVEGIPAGPQ